MESLAASLLTSTDLTANQTTPIRPDPLVFTVGGRFTRWKPNVIGSVSGWVGDRFTCRKPDVIRSVLGWAQT